MASRRYRPGLSNFVRVVALVACAGSLQGQPAVVVESNVMIPMRDGAKLATDIYRPASGGAPVAERLPILLQCS